MVTTRTASKAAAVASSASAKGRPPAKAIQKAGPSKKGRATAKVAVTVGRATAMVAAVDVMKLPVRARAPERLVRIAPCIWGANAQVMPLIDHRLKEEEGEASTSSENGKRTEEWKCETRPERSGLNLRTRDPFGTEIYFKLKPTTQLLKLFTAYCVRSNHAATDVEFSCSGLSLDGSETPAELGLEDGDIINVAFVGVM